MKEAPREVMQFGSNESLMNLDIILVFPTVVSPKSTTLQLTTFGFGIFEMVNVVAGD